MVEHSEQIDKIAPAFVKAQAASNGAKKASNNPHFKSKYADLTQVWAACEDALEANGLGIIQGLGEARDGVMHMDTMLLHTSGQWLSSHASIPLPKGDPQGYGSATTYLRRYALAAMLGVVQEDDDGNAARRTDPRTESSPMNADRITEQQEGDLVALAQEVGADMPKFEKYLGVRSLADLPADRYQEAVRGLEAKRVKKAA